MNKVVNQDPEHGKNSKKTFGTRKEKHLKQRNNK